MSQCIKSFRYALDYEKDCSALELQIYKPFYRLTKRFLMLGKTEADDLLIWRLFVKNRYRDGCDLVVTGQAGSELCIRFSTYRAVVSKLKVGSR